MSKIKSAPLSGVRIADFTIHAAGPFCTHLWTQLVYGRMAAATFDQVSANKLSVRLNLKHPEAVSLAKRLVSVSDVAAESFRPGVMKRLGLDFESLKEARSDIVLLSLSSCGQDGPDSHFAGYAPLFGAWGGLGWMSGYSDGPPIEMRHVMDHAAGTHAALALLAAMHQRRRTGHAQHVDLAAREVASAMIGDALILASMGQTPERTGNGDSAMAPHGVYATNLPDRWLTLVIRDDAEWQTLLRVLGQEDADSRFTTTASRLRHCSELDGQLTQWLATQDADSLAQRLQQNGVCAHVSWTMRDIADDLHLKQRKSVVEVSGPGIPARLAVGSPVRFSKTNEVGIRRLTPELGQDEDYVFGELLGLSAAQRADLQEREIIF
jgi:crotonobetainyl-CoA:carnitine CoA-transferase CaiB-like acyl-CoA transferase